MNLYTIVTGCYSDRSETWYSHEQEFTQAEFNELLEREWRATRAKLAGLFYARDIECQEWFGVEIDSIDWIFESCDSTLLEDPKTLAALKHGSLEQLKAFGIKYRDTFDATIDVLMRDAGFTEVTANAQLWLSHYPWDRTELDAFEKELRHETAKGSK